MADREERIPTLTVRGGPAGWQTQVEFDGKPVTCLRGLKFEVGVDGLAVAHLEVLCKPDIVAELGDWVAEEKPATDPWRPYQCVCGKSNSSAESFSIVSRGVRHTTSPAGCTPWRA